MKIAFPTLKVGYYPFPPGKALDATATRKLFAWGKSKGFDGVELEDATFGLTTMSGPELDAFKAILDESGLEPCAVKNGGDLYTPGIAEKNEHDISEAIRVAAHLGAKFISISLGTPVDHLGVSNDERLGGNFRYAGSMWAKQEDFEITAAAIRRLAQKAVDAGTEISLEIRSTSIVDNSESVLKLYKMVDHPGFSLNPDVANMVWAFMTPDEDWRDCLKAMAPYTNYLHLKNVYGMRIPELQRKIYKRGPLWDGVVDFRYLLSHMREIGYRGYVVIEGAGAGDMLYNFEQGLAYVRQLLQEIDTTA